MREKTAPTEDKSSDASGDASGDTKQPPIKIKIQPDVGGDTERIRSRSVLNLVALQARQMTVGTDPCVGVVANPRELEVSGDLPLGDNQILLLLSPQVARTLLKELQAALQMIEKGDFVDPSEQTH